MKCLGKGCGHIFGPQRLAGPFHIGTRELGRSFGAEERIERQDRTRLLTGGDHQRRAILPGGEQVAQCIAHACGGMQVDQRRLAAGLRMAIGHGDHRRLVQPEHVFHAIGKRLQHRQLGAARIAEQCIDAEVAEHGESGFAHGGGGRVPQQPAARGIKAAPPRSARRAISTISNTMGMATALIASIDPRRSPVASESMPTV